MKYKKNDGMNRRDFTKSMITIASGAPFFSNNLITKIKSEKIDHRNELPSMTYRKLGRTNFMCSRLVFGCGAALVGGRGVHLLDRAFESGINYFDCGSESYYKGNETSFAPFLKANRKNIWVTSKAMVDDTNDSQLDIPITLDQAKAASTKWTKFLNQSLKDLQTEYVDAYLLMNIRNPSILSSEEVYKAFLDAKAAGKVGFFGFSTHKNAKKVLEAAIKTKWYDIAMPGITPAGWYDWSTKNIEKDASSLSSLRSLLNMARKAGMGLIGMKTVRLMSPMSSLGKGDETVFNSYYDKKLLESPLNPFQRAYAYILENGLDVVNADMQNFTHLEDNIVAAATSKIYFD
jgi:aryl-alcohol dehydrogenase-like predicted oxidoreductase